MRQTSLRRFSNVLAGTLMRLTHRRCRRNVLPNTQIKLIHFNDQYWRPGPYCDIITMSHWYVNKTDQFETSQRCTNWHISETDQINTLQKRLNWYLNETDVFVATYYLVPWQLSLISDLRYLFNWLKMRAVQSLNISCYLIWYDLGFLAKKNF